MDRQRREERLGGPPPAPRPRSRHAARVALTRVAVLPAWLPAEHAPIARLPAVVRVPGARRLAVGEALHVPVAADRAVRVSRDVDGFYARALTRADAAAADAVGLALRFDGDDILVDTRSAIDADLRFLG